MLEQGECCEKHQGIILEQVVNRMSVIQINRDNAFEYYSDQLTQDLQRVGLIPSSSATILAHQMPMSDWKSMLTSDI